MGLKSYKPRSEGLRGRVSQDRKELTAQKPERRLTEAVRKTAGRNNKGRITTRHIGGGVKRRYRIVDFRRDKTGIPARVATIEYDPNRSANIALLNYLDGEKRALLGHLDAFDDAGVLHAVSSDLSDLRIRAISLSRPSFVATTVFAWSSE